MGEPIFNDDENKRLKDWLDYFQAKCNEAIKQHPEMYTEVQCPLCKYRYFPEDFVFCPTCWNVANPALDTDKARLATTYLRIVANMFNMAELSGISPQIDWWPGEYFTIRLPKPD